MNVLNIQPMTLDMSPHLPASVVVLIWVTYVAPTPVTANQMTSSTTSEDFSYRIPQVLGDDFSGASNNVNGGGTVSGNTVHHGTRHRHHNGKLPLNNDKSKNHNNNGFSSGDEENEEPDDSLLIETLNESEKLRNKFKHTFNFSWPLRELASVVDGEIVIGALHMIHERSDDKICGKIMDQGGIQALEAMLYTLDHVNGKFGHMLIPGVRIGVLAKDDCDTDIFGLEQALDFIRDNPAVNDTYQQSVTKETWQCMSVHNYFGLCLSDKDDHSKSMTGLNFG